MSSAADNAFMYSVIESCRHNEIDPGKYVNFLLGKLKTSRNGEDLTPWPVHPQKGPVLRTKGSF